MSKNIVYYYLKSGIDEGRLDCVIGQEDHVLSEEELNADPVRKELYKDTLLWEGDTPLIAGYPLVDENRPGYIRLATRKELIDMGLDSLKEGEVIQGDEVVKIEKPNNFATWNIDHWETDFDSLSDGWKIVDREQQKLEYVNQPNYHAKWNKETGTWDTDKYELFPGEKLLEDGTIENVEKPMDDNEHRYEWNAETFEWYNAITPEELKQNYHKIVSDLKVQCVDEGFMFRGYQQKCRTLDITWLTCRLQETYDDAYLQGQINDKYELQVERDQLKKVGWVFDYNEVLMLDFIDFKDMFDKGASYTQACYIAEEIIKGQEPINMNINIDDFRKVVSQFTEVESYNMPKDNVVQPMMRSRRSVSEEPVENHQPGHYSNPCFELGLNGADVMIAAYLHMTLEEYAELKKSKQEANTLEEPSNK